MASNQDSSLEQCTSCHGGLNLQSKTLPCSHSFCPSCLSKNFGNSNQSVFQCPECKTSVVLDQLTLLPDLVNILRRRQLKIVEWQCDICFEAGIESMARTWCQDCKELVCNNCIKHHKRYYLNHKQKHFQETEIDEAMQLLSYDLCDLHCKMKNWYCERCNTCLCDTCYQQHSPFLCLQRSSFVKQERFTQGSVTERMDEVETSTRRMNEGIRKYTDELKAECNNKCKQIRADFEEMQINAERRKLELCHEIIRLTDEQVKKWRLLLEENERILKHLEVWRINLRHKLNESQQEMDVTGGLRMLESKLSSQLQKRGEKCNLRVRYPEWWLQHVANLKDKMIESVCLTIGNLSIGKDVIYEKKWNLPGLKNFNIQSIQVSKEDNHVFLCDGDNDSVIEFNEEGRYVGNCDLNQGTDGSPPRDICSVSANIFAVITGRRRWYEKEKIIFLERKKMPPFLKIKTVLETREKTYYYSLCQSSKTIFLSDCQLNVDTLSNREEENMSFKTIRCTRSSRFYFPRIRADSFGNIWLTKIGSSELKCFNTIGQLKNSLEIQEPISDFYLNEIGNFYFCNKKGIFTFNGRKKLLYTFENESQVDPKIFVSKTKVYIYLRINGKDLIKIFGISN